MAGTVLAHGLSDLPPSWRATGLVAGPGRTERRILLSFVRYGVLAQPAFSVRGSSRRIMAMRFRPADIRVINRRFRLLPCYLLCRPPGSSEQKHNRAQPEGLTRSPHIRTAASTRVASRGCFPIRPADCRPRRRAWRPHHRTRLGWRDYRRGWSHSLRRTDWR
jgi:hypothetical protein